MALHHHITRADGGKARRRRLAASSLAPVPRHLVLAVSHSELTTSPLPPLFLGGFFPFFLYSYITYQYDYSCSIRILVPVRSQ